MSRSKIRWEPRLKFYFHLKTDAIYTLRGPRQVGKTTLLKQFVGELLDSGIDPQFIFYHTCNLVETPKELVEIVSAYVDAVRQDADNHLHIFLDEISSVREWQKGVKHLVENGKLENCTVILTGSHAIDMMKTAEKLPGRRGGEGEETLDKVLLPMKFAEYVETRTKLRDVPRFRFIRQEYFNEIISGTIPKEIHDLSLYSKELKILFQEYLITGGIPRVMDEYVRTNSISQSTYKTYVDAAVGDMTKWDKKEAYLKQIVSRVSETIGTPVSWNALRSDTDIASHMTVADYVDTLGAAFILIYLYRLDASRDGPAVERDKKVYFHDPFIFHALRAWASGRDPYEQTIQCCKDPQLVSGLVEGVVADHLIRWAFGESRQKAFFDYSNTLFHWRSEKREVDFVMKLQPKLYSPLELKYQTRIGREDRQGIIDFYKTGLSTRGVFLSREELREDRNGVVIPVWLFLLLV